MLSVNDFKETYRATRRLAFVTRVVTIRRKTMKVLADIFIPPMIRVIYQINKDEQRRREAYDRQRLSQLRKRIYGDPQ